MTSTTIDALPEDGTFPDFAGVGVDKAITLLSAAGFGQVQAVDGTGQNRLVDATDAWVVAAQSVPPGLAIDKSTPITLFVVSDGETASSPADLGFVEVPEVLYLPVGDALDDLVALGLTTVVLNDFSGAGRAVPPDETWVITSQLPVAGSWSTLAQQVSLGALPKDEIPKPKD